MPDFEELRKQLRAAEQRADVVGERARLIREQNTRRQVEAFRLARVAKARPNRYADRARKLEAANRAGASTKTESDRNRGAAAAALIAARAAFEQFMDPRIAVTHMRDDVPFLLFPIRIEARFKTVGGDHQLCVRVFPDDCCFDTFEPVPSEDEVESTREYWAELWQAGGIEDQERAAWRNLVTGHGAGRAAWLIDNYKPVNPSSKPAKNHPEDVVLVLTSEGPPIAGESTATASFWRAMWIAGGKKAQTDPARATLRSAIGVARAAEVEKAPPVNFRQKPNVPFTRDQIQVSAVFLVFPPADQVEIQRHTWSRPPRVAAWPDRFVLVGYRAGKSPLTVLGKSIPNPLIAGIDPSADPTEQLRSVNGELRVPDAMKWMLDFDRAVDIGMGFRVSLDAAAAQGGFDKIIVVGVKATADPEAGRADLESLITHHRYGAHGVAILGQGTPTNNTEEVGSGFSMVDEADETFNDLFLSASHPRPVASPDWLSKTDGQWVTELLGINPAAVAGLPGSAGVDQAEARRMNRSLWPGTLGYWMDTMMNPAFSADTVDRTRGFFTRFVSGRGPVPAIRIGTQPYGILPVTAFSRTAWMSALGPSTPPTSSAARERRYFEGLRDILKVASQKWKELANNVPVVGAAGDPHQILLDVVGLHPSSVTYAERFSESFDTAFNWLRLTNFIVPQITADQLVQEGTDLLLAHGLSAAKLPEILKQFQFTSSFPLTGPVVDTVPLSEQTPIRSYTADQKNYIDWLVTAARTSLTALQQQTGFAEPAPPAALLYLMLRYALLEGYYDAGLQLREVKLNLSPEMSLAARLERSFVYVDPQAPDSDSRVAILTLPNPQVTGRANIGVGEHIRQGLKTMAEAKRLSEQIDALEMLAKTPTARLERLFAEHVDCCSYRLDAWITAVVNAQLAEMRNLHDGQELVPNKGVLLGAYGWLLDLHPRVADFTPVQLSDQILRNHFNRSDQPPLTLDSTNGGFIHAPSLNHAVAAAVLRSGYLANATSTNPETFAVRLSSERVRRALGILDGMRAGQSLGALLGYQFERGLHDRHTVGELDAFIYSLRQEFPLQLDRMASTQRKDADKKDSIEARDVVDGERLVEHVRARIAAGQSSAYPFGKSLPNAPGPVKSALDGEVARLLDTFDAVADLLMAEGVYQAVHGNYDRVAATLDAAAGVNLPPDPEIIRTPSRGFPLTQRVALHLDSAAVSNPRPGSVATPLSKAQPALNAWLTTTLPSLTKIACKVSYRASTGEQVVRDVSLADLGLQPIDVLRVLRDQSGDELISQELRDRIVHYLGGPNKPLDLDHEVAKLEIDPLQPSSTSVPLCHAIPLVRAMRSLLAAARPLLPTDLTPPGEGAVGDGSDIAIDRQRITAVKTDLQALKTQLSAFRTTWESKVAPSSSDSVRAEVVAGIDTLITGGMDLLVKASAFGLTAAGWRFIHERRSEIVGEIRRSLKELIDRWTASLAEYDAIMSGYAGAATTEARFVLLERAERRVSSAGTPRPAGLTDFHTTVQGKRAPFEQRRDRFKSLYGSGVSSLSKLLSDWRGLLPVAAFDVVEPDLKPFEMRIHAFAADIVASAVAILNALDDPRAPTGKPSGRLPIVDAQLVIYDASTDPNERVGAMQTAGRALLGEDVTLIPDFALADEHADEIANAVTGSPGLLEYLTVTEHVDFPVDEWLYTCARVREPMQRWERIVMLTGALGVAEPALIPLQLPYRENDRWVAAKIPLDYAAEGERLLYTACFAKPYMIGQRQSGLLLDEWSEVIPLPEKVPGESSEVPKQTTGIAFHFDRPNAQPPQTMLLVTPTAARGTWQWNDLVDAVNETIDLARIRGVEPAQLDATPYATFLPATTTAASAKQVTFAANLFLNNLGTSLSTAFPP